MKKQHVQLRKIDREFLEALISKGELTAKAYRRALALLELDRGQTFTATSGTLQVTIPTLSKWAARYRETGLAALQDNSRSGHRWEPESQDNGLGMQ